MFAPILCVSRSAAGATLSFFVALAVFAGAPSQALANLQISAGSPATFSTAYDYGAERYNDVVVAADGTSYLVGSSDGPMQDNYSDLGEEKAFVHKVSPSGQILAEKVFRCSGQGVAGLRILDLDSQSLLVVLEEGTDVTVWTKYRLWRISKTDLQPLWSEGRELVYRVPGGYAYQATFAASGAGNYVICRRVEGYESSTAPSNIEYYDAGGNLLWQDTLGFQYSYTAHSWGSTAPRLRNTDLGHAMKFAPNGDFIIGGSSNNGTIPKVARYSSDGSKLFELMLPNINPGTIRTITCDDEGNAYALNLLGTFPAKEILLTKISPNGTVLASRQWTRLNNDYNNYHSYSLAFLLGQVVVFEDTFSGIGGAQPYFHVLSKSLQLLASKQFSLGSVSPSDSHPYSVGAGGRLVAAGRSGRDAVRVSRTISGGSTPSNPPSAVLQPQTIKMPFPRLIRIGRLYKLKVTATSRLPVSVSLDINNPSLAELFVSYSTKGIPTYYFRLNSAVTQPFTLTARQEGDGAKWAAANPVSVSFSP